MVSPRRRHHLSASLGNIALFVVPALVLYGVVFLYPVFAALANGFFEWTGTKRLGFVGIENFSTLFSLEPYASQFWTALGHNAYFFVGTMIVQNGVGLILAFLLNRTIPGRRFFQTIVSVPYLMSALVIGYAWSMLLSPQFGVVNAAIKALGGSPIAWLGTPAMVMPILILINSWQWCGVSMLLFGAGLAGIPREQIEAARTDGASAWRIAWSIELPQLVPQWSVVTVLTLIGSLNLFDLVYAIGGTSGGVGGSADVAQTLFYRVAFSNAPNAYGLSGAFSLVLLALTFGLTLGTQFIFRRAERGLQ